MDNAIEFMGGEKELKEYHNYYIEKYIISFSTGGSSSSDMQKVYFQKPNKLRIENYLHTLLKDVYVYRDNRGWLLSLDEVIEIEDDVSTGDIWLNGLDYLVILKQSNLSISEDELYYIINFTAESGLAYKFYFNRLNYCLDKICFSLLNNIYEITLSDYRVIEGSSINYPFSREIFLNGLEICVEKVKVIELDKRFDEEIFNKPESEKDEKD
ncbi:MAG: hypothetical protein PHV06_00125 [bacterium]|nr:hypothetical protein [bacterium]